MQAARHSLSRARARRGLTLLEMLVTVALLLLVMAIIAAVFQQATGAMHIAKIVGALDNNLRRLDGVIRQDLDGITAHMDPSNPKGPADGYGYFTYEENANADPQGEDSDDVMAFTAKAPPGLPFTGRLWVPRMGTAAGSSTLEPITVTSDYAEIIYFVRDGDLYRRVLLIMPGRASTLGLVQKEAAGPTIVRAQSASNVGGDENGTSAANGLNGFANSLFNLSTVSWQGFNDISARPAPLFDLSGAAGSPVPTPNSVGDLTDRQNRFAHPRFADDFSRPGGGGPDGVPDDFVGVQYPNGPVIPDGQHDFHPVLYPNAINSGLVSAVGLTAGNYDIRPFPYVSLGQYSTQAPATPFHLPWGGNHNPILTGESAGMVVPNPGTAAQLQTWWGRPTWRETMSPAWLDPVWRVNGNANFNQAFGLSWVTALSQSRYPLPPRTDYPNDPNAGTGGNLTPTLALALSSGVWEDDKILSGVRSFDVKAFDPYAPVYGFTEGYYDLGYANASWTGPAVPGFGHEGRMPPRPVDGRLDAQTPYLAGNTPNYVTDDNNDTIRLQRVFDTWSTTYARAPYRPMQPEFGPPNLNSGGTPIRPLYPSFPAPYATPLRGLQIQIRVVDPKNTRTKVLTIRQDFSRNVY